MTTNIFSNLMNNNSNNNSDSSNKKSAFSLFTSYILENAWVENHAKDIEFTEEECNRIITAKVVAGKYGNSVRIRYVEDGKQKIMFVPLSINSKLKLDELVDCSKCRFICLEKQGEDDIYRIEEK